MYVTAPWSGDERGLPLWLSGSEERKRGHGNWASTIRSELRLPLHTTATPWETKSDGVMQRTKTLINKSNTHTTKEIMQSPLSYNRKVRNKDLNRKWTSFSPTPHPFQYFPTPLLGFEVGTQRPLHEQQRLCLPYFLLPLNTKASNFPQRGIGLRCNQVPFKTPHNL